MSDVYIKNGNHLISIDESKFDSSPYIENGGFTPITHEKATIAVGTQPNTNSIRDFQQSQLKPIELLSIEENQLY